MYVRETKAVLTLILSLIAIFPADIPAEQYGGTNFSGNVRCLLDLDYRQTGGLYAGMHYEMLKTFGTAANFTPKIEDNLYGSACLDSLRSGAIDLIATKVSDSLDTDGLLMSSPMDGGIFWIIRNDQHTRIKEVNAWYANFNQTKEYEELRGRFMASYSPYKRLASGKTFRHLSPYDPIIRKYATTIGWDWRMFAALIWFESKYSICAHSHKDARGIMQLRPITARHLGVTDPLDPEENIAAGAKLLATLEKNLSPHVEDRQELDRLILEAYNSGLRRTLTSIDPADSLGVKPTEEPKSSVYADSVRSVYRIFCMLTTEP